MHHQWRTIQQRQIQTYLINCYSITIKRYITIILLKTGFYVHRGLISPEDCVGSRISIHFIILNENPNQSDFNVVEMNPKFTSSMITMMISFSAILIFSHLTKKQGQYLFYDSLNINPNITYFFNFLNPIIFVKVNFAFFVWCWIYQEDMWMFTRRVVPLNIFSKNKTKVMWPLKPYFIAAATGGPDFIPNCPRQSIVKQFVNHLKFHQKIYNFFKMLIQETHAEMFSLETQKC